MERHNFTQIGKAARFARAELFDLGSGALFIVLIMLVAGISLSGTGSHMLIAAAMTGGYMAMNIGAAWIITVPLSGALAVMLYFTLREIMLP